MIHPSRGSLYARTNIFLLPHVPFYTNLGRLPIILSNVEQMLPVYVTVSRHVSLVVIRNSYGHYLVYGTLKACKIEFLKKQWSSVNCTSEKIKTKMDSKL